MRVRNKGSFKKIRSFLDSMERRKQYARLYEWANVGLDALSSATPIDTGLTASSWIATIEQDADKTRVVWSNTNVNKGVNIAIILQYGHGTRNGGWVEGYDYINPAIRPVMDAIADNIWAEVQSL